MTRHLWVLVVLTWDGFMVTFSVGMFPSGVRCRRLYCGSRIFVGRIETVKSPLIWYRFLEMNAVNLCCWGSFSEFREPQITVWPVVECLVSCSGSNCFSTFWLWSIRFLFLRWILFRTCCISPMVSRSITSGFCPHCLYHQREAIHFSILDRLQIFCLVVIDFNDITLMAWLSNIPQKSFLCERLSIPSLEWFLFYMQMAISTTGRRPLCILCSVSVLSKMLKLRSAEGSSFRLCWMLSAFLLLRHRHCALHQTHWCLGSVRLLLRQMCTVIRVFWGEALSDGELAVARTVCFCVFEVTPCWWIQMFVSESSSLLSGIVRLWFWGSSLVSVRYFLGQRGMTLSDFCSLSASVVDDVRWAFLIHHMLMKADVGFWGFIVGCDPSDLIWVSSLLALISERVCHNCLVPGFTDGAGFLFCDDVVKTENLDWIFLLDVSHFEAGLWTHQYCWIRRVMWICFRPIRLWLLR
jgi:hypothetical protein